MELTKETIDYLAKVTPGYVAIYRVNGSVVETLYHSPDLPDQNGMSREEYDRLTAGNASTIVLSEDLAGIMNAIRKSIVTGDRLDHLPRNPQDSRFRLGACQSADLRRTQRLPRIPRHLRQRIRGNGHLPENSEQHGPDDLHLRQQNAQAPICKRDRDKAPQIHLRRFHRKHLLFLHARTGHSLRELRSEPQAGNASIGKAFRRGQEHLGMHHRRIRELVRARCVRALHQRRHGTGKARTRTAEYPQLRG